MYKRTIQETVKALAERNPDFIRAGSLNVSAVARAAKMNQPTLKRILDGDSQNPGVENEEKICRLFKITVEQLRGKAGIPGIDKGFAELGPTTDTSTAMPASNVSPGPEIKGWIPLISFTAAGNWEEIIDLYEPGDAESVHPTTVPHSIHTFALRVDGDSMTPPSGTPGYSFPHGMIIYVDPDLRGDVVTGDYVVARHGDDDRATFKQLATEEGRPILKPLNPSDKYPIIRDEFEIIGKVIDATWGGL